MIKKRLKNHLVFQAMLKSGKHHSFATVEDCLMDSFRDSWNSISGQAKKLINKFDSDHDLQLDDKELAVALQDSSLEREESKVVSIFAGHRFHLDKAYLPPLSVSEIDSVSARMLNHDALRFQKLYTLTKDFADIDIDGSGALSKSELETYATNSDGELFSNKRIAEPMFDEISKDGSESRVCSLAKEALDLEIWARSIENCNLADSRTPARSLPAFVHESNRLKDISPFVGRQGFIKNCYFQAAVSAIAKANPDAIARLIEDNGNGTYSVRFPGQEKIVVTRPTIAEQLVFNGASKEGSWVSVLERAYGVLEQRRSRNFGIPQLTLNAGGMLATVIEDITGQKARSFRKGELADMSLDELRNTIRKSFESGRPMCCATTKTGFEAVVDLHGYSIVGFKPAGAEGGTVILHNVWNDSTLKYANMVSISVKQFKNCFTNLTIGHESKTGATGGSFRRAR